MDKAVYWYLCKLPEPSIAIGCLSPNERKTYQEFRFEARRNSWLAGRFAAKTLLSKVYNPKYNPDQIEIVNNDLGAPCAYHANQPLAGCLSISHSGKLAAAAFASLDGHTTAIRVGIDIEAVAQRTPGFIQDYFTENEVALVSVGTAPSGSIQAKPFPDLPVERATLIWSAKEALLKALGIGLRVDTRQVEVTSIGEIADSGGWKHFQALSPQINAPIDGYWRRMEHHLLTIVILKETETHIHLVEID